MSSVGYGPLWRIDGPSPLAPLYTLLGAARIVDDLDAQQLERWINGVAVYPYPPDLAFVWDACSSGSDRVKAEAGAIPLPQFGAMVVYLTETCTTSGIFGAGLSADEAQARFTARAVAAFAAVESAAVEREFLAGDVLLNPHLADGNGAFPWGDSATSVVNAFALLEGEIATSGKRGLIHVSPALAIGASAQHLLDRDEKNGVLRTINGTVVVPGAGYFGGPAPKGHTSPTGTEEWAYATGPVEARRSEIFTTPENLSEALDRDSNTITYRAERYYAVDWDTVVQAAVLVDRCTDACGTNS